MVNVLPIVTGLLRRARRISAGIGPLVISQVTMARLKAACHFDPATGLFRDLEYINLAIKVYGLDSLAMGKPFSLLFVDLDHFKEISELYGHVEGNKMLRIVCLAMKEQLRGDEELMRFGGDEFVVLLPGANQEQARGIAENLRQKIEATKVLLTAPDGGKTSESLTASFGGVTVENISELEDPQALIDRTDQLMYRAKRAGGNTALF